MEFLKILISFYEKMTHTKNYVTERSSCLKFFTTLLLTVIGCIPFWSLGFKFHNSLHCILNEWFNFPINKKSVSCISQSNKWLFQVSKIKSRQNDTKPQINVRIFEIFQMLVEIHKWKKYRFQTKSLQPPYSLFFFFADKLSRNSRLSHKFNKLLTQYSYMVAKFLYTYI